MFEWNIEAGRPKKNKENRRIVDILVETAMENEYITRQMMVEITTFISDYYCQRFQTHQRDLKNAGKPEAQRILSRAQGSIVARRSRVSTIISSKTNSSYLSQSSLIVKTQ